LENETSSDSQRGRRSSRRGYSDGRNRFSSCRGSRAECACQSAGRIALGLQAHSALDPRHELNRFRPSLYPLRGAYSAMADSLVRSAGRTGETALTAETSSDSQRGRRSSRQPTLIPVDQRLTLKRCQSAGRIALGLQAHSALDPRPPSGLRLVSSPSKARLCFPATINTENEVEEMDLLERKEL
jgi:hypothetical protein